jgi:hypothetical protein
VLDLQRGVVSGGSEKRRRTGPGIESSVLTPNVCWPSCNRLHPSDVKVAFWEARKLSASSDILYISTLDAEDPLS